MTGGVGNFQFPQVGNFGFPLTPTAEFVPRGFRGLPAPLPGAGGATVPILGDLTIRGVTRPTTSEGTAEFRVVRVLSIEHHIRLEVDLTLRAAS